MHAWCSYTCTVINLHLRLIAVSEQGKVTALHCILYTVTSPVATVPLQPLPRRVSTPYSRPAFLLPSPPLSPLLPSPFKSSLLLYVFLTLVILLQISPL